MKNNLYVFRMKAIFGDKLTCIIMVLSLSVFLFIVNQLSLNAGERSSIPIGLLNLDHSESADQLVNDIKGIPALYVYEDGENELKELLYKEQIRGYFVINKDYEKSVKAANTDELINMYYLEEDESVKILSDIIAGEMLYKICLYKGYNLYQSLPQINNNKSSLVTDNGIMIRYSEEEYVDYAKSLLSLSDFNFAFDISMINIEKHSNNGKIDNSILYLQVIWGIVAMLLSFSAMLMTAGIVMEKEMGINKRVNISLCRPFIIDLSHFGAAFTVQSILAALISISLIGKITDFTIKQGGMIFLSMELFSMVMGLWFLFLGKLSSRVSRYQLAGVLSILLFGLLGFLNLMAGFIDNKLLNISKFIPNCWFIEQFTDIILKTTLQDIPYISYSKLIITAFGLLILNGLISRTAV